MAKTRQQQSAAKAVANGPRKAKSRTKGGKRASRPQWLMPLIIVAVVLSGLIAWWVYSSVVDDNGEGTSDGAQPIAMVESADFHSLLVDPQDPEHIVFGSHAGIQESRDGGLTWEAGALRNADAMQLASSPDAPETFYATGHDVFQVTRDGGRSWQAQAHNLPGTDIHGFAQDLANPQRLYAFVAGSGIFMSADGGTDWQPLPAQPPGGGMHVALAASGGSLYAATGEAITASHDGGQTWQALSTQPFGQVISLAAPASDPQILYAGTPVGLARSADGGESWTSLGPENVLVLAIAVTPDDPDRILFVNDQGAIYRSDDGGASWR